MKGQETEANTARRKTTLAVPNINVTPLIDILLVLLITFMVIRPQREAKFETQIPQKPDADVSRQEPAPDLLVVDIKGGTGIEQIIELNTRPMTLTELGMALKEILEHRADKTVYLKAPRGKPYREVVYVIDKIKEVGAGPIGLQIDFLS